MSLGFYYLHDQRRRFGIDFPVRTFTHVLHMWLWVIQQGVLDKRGPCVRLVGNHHRAAESA